MSVLIQIVLGFLFATAKFRKFFFISYISETENTNFSKRTERGLRRTNNAFEEVASEEYEGSFLK